MGGTVKANGQGRPAPPPALAGPAEQIGFAPLATQINVAGVTGPDGEKFVMVQFMTAAGIGVYFVPPEGARIVASQIRAAADSSLGLHLPPASPFG